MPVLVDLSSPRLDSALEGRPDLVKLNDWELAEYVAARSPSRASCARPPSGCATRGAGAVVVTRGGDPALVLSDEGAWEFMPAAASSAAPARAAATR